MITGNTFYLNFEPALMIWLQRYAGTAGTMLAIAATHLGEEAVLVGVLGFVYWCYDKEFGKYVGVNIVTALVCNPMLKNIALRRRPYFDHPQIKCLKPVKSGADIYDITAQGFSFPSGHSMNSVTVYGSLAMYKKTKVLTAIAIIVPLLVGFSRVMLGVHYPTDVFVGWVMGGLILVVMTRLQRMVKRKWILFLVIFLLSALGIFYCRTTDYFTALGIQGGFFLSVLFEEKYVHFEVTRKPLVCVVRVLCGVLAYLILNTLLKLPFSKDFLESVTMASFLVRALRYALVSFLTIGVYPMAFRLEKKLSKPKAA